MEFLQEKSAKKYRNMKVVHISMTPLAGAPIRIVNALNLYTDFKSRLINFDPDAYGSRTFPEDLIWQKNKEESLDIIKEADILHFHHFIELNNNLFEIDFLKIAKNNVKIIRHFHSDLAFYKGNEEKILNDKYSKIVIPHYPERTFLNTFIVPNIIPIYDEVYLPKKVINKKNEIFFSVSLENSMWSDRWKSKGLPEVEKKFNNLKKNYDFNFNIIKKMPYFECQRIKQNNDIVIGDITSGSYHLTDLEALSMGKPTFTYLDNRTQLVIQNLLQCDDLPFINTRLEEVDLPFLELLKNKDLQKDIGNFSRYWVEKYYNPEKLVKFYVEVYTKLLNNEPIHRQNYLEFSKAKCYLYNDLYNLQWERRKQMFKNKFNKSYLIEIIKNIISIKKINKDDKKIKYLYLFNIKIKLKTYKKLNFKEKENNNKIISELNFNTDFDSFLLENKKERMDANRIDLFDIKRCDFHKDRYRLACEYTENKIVLDIASGTGYGADILYNLGRAKKVFGVDLSQESVNYANITYKSDFISYKQGSILNIPFEDNSFDVLTSFETIEHVADDKKQIQEIKRVLKKDGLYILSTPNDWDNSVNEFHVKDYDYQSIKKLISDNFEIVKIYNQNSGNVERLENHNMQRMISLANDENYKTAECFIIIARNK